MKVAFITNVSSLMRGSSIMFSGENGVYDVLAVHKSPEGVELLLSLGYEVFTEYLPADFLLLRVF